MSMTKTSDCSRLWLKSLTKTSDPSKFVSRSMTKTNDSSRFWSKSGTRTCNSYRICQIEGSPKRWNPLGKTAFVTPAKSICEAFIKPVVCWWFRDPFREKSPKSKGDPMKRRSSKMKIYKYANVKIYFGTRHK